MHDADSKPYARSLREELEWKLIDQLHSAVSQLSGFCFEIKKFCVTTLFVVLAFLTKFTNDKLDTALFVTVTIVILGFWFLDATSYFYQVKLRGRMQTTQAELLEKNIRQVIPTTNGFPEYISAKRVESSQLKRVRAAGFNHSMWIYAILMAINIFCWALYIFGEFS